MDVPRVLRQARSRAGFTKTALAAQAGTSVAALIAYESARRSPTVRTLDRLLAACDLQVRVELEPLRADLDAAVDALLSGPRVVPDNRHRLADALTEAGLQWAFDGRTALVLQGLAADATFAEVVAVGDEPLRRFLYRHGVGAVDRNGDPIWDSWLRLDLSRVAPSMTWTRYGALTLRVADRLPPLLSIRDDGDTFPVLSLLDLEAAHRDLADLLARLRERGGRGVVP
jgi:transcriptional regulator with XRE-family HTH domain